VRPGPARVHVRTAPTSVAARRALVASGPVHRRFGDRYRPSHEPAVAAAAAPGRRSECPRSAPTMKGRPAHFRGRRATFRSQLQLLLLLLLLLLVPRPGNRPVRLRILTVPATATARPGSKSRRNRRSSDADRGRRVRCDRDHAFLIVVPARGHALSGDGAGRRFADSPPTTGPGMQLAVRRWCVALPGTVGPGLVDVRRHPGPPEHSVTVRAGADVRVPLRLASHR
jgi:hypothetical protein